MVSVYWPLIPCLSWSHCDGNYLLGFNIWVEYWCRLCSWVDWTFLLCLQDMEEDVNQPDSFDYVQTINKASWDDFWDGWWFWPSRVRILYIVSMTGRVLSLFPLCPLNKAVSRIKLLQSEFFGRQAGAWHYCGRNWPRHLLEGLLAWK